MVFTKARLKICGFAEEVVIAETDANRSNASELRKPANETVLFGFGFDVIEVIDEVARNRDYLRVFLFGGFCDFGEICGSFAAKMRVADGENLVFFLARLIETIADMVESFHLY